MNNNETKSKSTSHQCQICGAFALHSNFGVLTCSPCKMFFKRNAQIRQKQFKCYFDGHCQINILNRRICPFCRLQKCFLNGMQIELIRASTSKQNITKYNKKIIKQSRTKISNHTLITNSSLIQFPTLNLFETNQSILTIDQWKLFSNLMISCDQHISLSLAERYIIEQNILPFKFRFKLTSVEKFISSLFSQIGLIFEKNPHLILFDCDDRSILLDHQMKYLLIINFSFLVEQSHLIDYFIFNKAIENLFQIRIIIKNKFLYFDLSFIKLSFGIILFSSYDYLIQENISIKYLKNIKELIQIQNIYIELAWKYLIYVYDEKQAIHSFSNFIQYLFILIDKMILFKDNEDFMKMINIIIQQTEQSFILNNK